MNQIFFANEPESWFLNRMPILSVPFQALIGIRSLGIDTNEITEFLKNLNILFEIFE